MNNTHIHTLIFLKTRETKGALRYEDVTAESTDAVICNQIYLRKRFLTAPYPEKITITINTGDSTNA